jgi:outer membrane protein assembly factor BamD
MNGRIFASLTLSAVLISGATAVVAQNPAKVQSDASPSQRVEVLRSRLEQMRRSLNSAVAAVNSNDNGKKEKDADDPRKRLAGLEKEAASVLSEVSDIRGKIDRAERYEVEKIAGLETSAADLQVRVDSALQATAGARNASATVSSSSKSKKKKGKLFGLLGGGGDDKYADLTGTVAAGRDKVLFEDAAHEVRKSNHEVGRLLFNTIITTYPDSPYLPLAKLAIADSFYLEGTTSSLIQAASAYNDWLTFFPTDPLADRVMLKMAECEMRQMGLPDREITKARKAEQRLKVLLQQFPDTSLKTDVSTRLNEVQENLGMHSLIVARFYDDRQKNHHGGLKGAQSRLQEILEKYPNFSHSAEVNFRLGATYVLEEEPDEAAKYFQAVVRDHPNSDFAEKAKEQLQLIGAPVPEPDPIKANQPEPEMPSFTQRIMTEVTGSADITVDKNGILISKDKDNEGKDLIDQAIANQGQIAPSSVPVAPINRRPPAKNVVPTPVPAASTTSSVGAQKQPTSGGGSPKP